MQIDRHSLPNPFNQMIFFMNTTYCTLLNKAKCGKEISEKVTISGNHIMQDKLKTTVH